jgi:hypothetical protein
MRTSTGTVRALPTGTDLAFLQGPQQLDLEGRRGVADFVEEQRAAVGLLEKADAIFMGAGECALLVAEELGFEQRVGQGTAVFDDEARSARSLEKWMARASSSLPVPDSPVISTDSSCPAIFRASSQTAFSGLSAARVRRSNPERALSLPRRLATRRTNCSGSSRKSSEQALVLLLKSPQIGGALQASAAVVRDARA